LTAAPYRHRTRGGQHITLLVITVAHYKPSAVLVDLINELFHMYPGFLVSGVSIPQNRTRSQPRTSSHPGVPGYGGAAVPAGANPS
jgi:hypothetical protein